jgi:hypothetical protein
VEFRPFYNDTTRRIDAALLSNGFGYDNIITSHHPNKNPSMLVLADCIRDSFIDGVLNTKDS